MALALGTNSGFVTVAPTTDPNPGFSQTIDGSSVVTKHTTPAGAVRITEIGWYRGAGTNTANFEVALYSDSAGVAATRLFVDATNSSSLQDWITVSVDWAVSPSTDYWLGLQMDAHSGSSSVDFFTSGGAGMDVRTSQTALADPYGGGAVSDADGLMAIYALVEVAVAPTVTTQAVSSIAQTTATGNGNVTADGGATVTERGVVANTGGTPTTSDLKFAAGAGGTGAYTASMTGLSASTHYFVRAYAINSQGTSYGSQVEFDTLATTLTQGEAAFYEDGTENGSSVISAGADSITRDVSSGDSNVQLRVRLQNNTAGAGLSTDDYQLQYEVNDSGTYINVGSGPSVVATYYFDGSDAPASDPNNVWTNETNADDGDIDTDASTSTNGTEGTNYLQIEGTNAPGSGGTISQVRARVHNGSIFSSYSTISAPGGGWTWAKIQALEVRARRDGLDDFTNFYVYEDGNAGGTELTQFTIVSLGSSIFSKIEIEVTSTGDAPVTGFNSGSLTDGNATTNRLGSGTGSFVAGKISEDGLVDNLQITASNYTELMASLTVVADAVADGDTIDFRWLRNGATTGMTYTTVPRITIEKGGGGGTVVKDMLGGGFIPFAR